MIKKDVFFSGMPSKVNTAKISTNILILAVSLFFGYYSNDWLLWGAIMGLGGLFLVANLITYYTKVYFRQNHVSFYDKMGIPRKIAYDKIVGIYDTPCPTLQPLVNISGTIRINYLSQKGRLLESEIVMKNHDSVYCELSARCPNVPFASSEFENPRFVEYYKYNPKASHLMFVGYVLIYIALLAGLIYWALGEINSIAYLAPTCIFIIGTGLGVLLYKKIRKLDLLFSKSK